MWWSKETKKLIVPTAYEQTEDYHMLSHYLSTRQLVELTCKRDIENISHDFILMLII